jgi:ferritin heavy chain
MSANMLLQRSSAFAGRMAVATRPSPTAAGFAAPARQLHHTVMAAQAAPVHKGHQGESGADITPQNGTTSISLTEGFKPFEEVKPEYAQIEQAQIMESGLENSFAREHYSTAIEKGINEQINTHYNLMYAYSAMASYFARDNVALLGFAKVFRSFANQQYGHALVFHDYQAKRGGHVQLGPINPPQMDYKHKKGDALYSMELTVGFEKLSFRKLRELHAVTDEEDDAQAQDFVETRLTDQVNHVKIVADYVAELRRLGKGHGTWHFDRLLRDGTIDPANAYTTNLAPPSYN